ncbi:MAG: hypothetical protein CEN90_253 [Parcubacteria group bacterium Licking1014_17]|nr:MAG: hypothetical protein CEN90_253 [Parcubacteria group bacterium Licking1014_17]
MEFKYKAKDEAGKLIAGKIEAATDTVAINTLQQIKLTVVSLEQIKENAFIRDVLGWFSGPNNRDLVIFTRQLATLIDAGMPLLEGLKILGEQTQKASFAKIILNIAASVEGGTSLSMALSDYDYVFNDLYISLVKIGEVSGKLQGSLMYLADYLERSAGLASKIKSALYYPAFVLVVMSIVGIIMMTTIIPKLLVVIEESGVTEIPMTTRVLMWLSNFINGNAFLLITLFLAAVISIYFYLRTESGKYRLDNLKIHMPRFGSIVRNLYLARISETLSTLIRAGVPILNGLTIAADSVGNAVYKDILLKAKESVQGGGTISEVFRKYKEFPPLASSMIETGEKTAKTDYMFENIFKFYKSEAETSIQNLSQLLEPIIIVVLGVGVAFLVAAVLMPIYSLVGGG